MYFPTLRRDTPGSPRSRSLVPFALILAINNMPANTTNRRSRNHGTGLGGARENGVVSSGGYLFVFGDIVWCVDRSKD